MNRLPLKTNETHETGGKSETNEINVKINFKRDSYDFMLSLQ